MVLHSNLSPAQAYISNKIYNQIINRLIFPYFREMFELFNVNDQKGLTVFEIENGVVDMTQTGDMFDRYGGRQLTFRL